MRLLLLAVVVLALPHTAAAQDAPVPTLPEPVEYALQMVLEGTEIAGACRSGWTEFRAFDEYSLIECRQYEVALGGFAVTGVELYRRAGRIIAVSLRLDAGHSNTAIQNEIEMMREAIGRMCAPGALDDSPGGFTCSRDEVMPIVFVGPIGQHMAVGAYVAVDEAHAHLAAERAFDASLAE